MPYYLVHFTLAKNYFDARNEDRKALTADEIKYGKELFRAGIWKHAFTTPGEIKTESWAVYQTSNEAELERLLVKYPMDRKSMYTRKITEVEIVDPPRAVGLLFSLLRSLGFFRMNK